MTTTDETSLGRLSFYRAPAFAASPDTASYKNVPPQAASAVSSVTLSDQPSAICFVDDRRMLVGEEDGTLTLVSVPQGGRASFPTI
jgi:hypothetical protein